MFLQVFATIEGTEVTCSKVLRSPGMCKSATGMVKMDCLEAILFHSLCACACNA